MKFEAKASHEGHEGLTKPARQSVYADEGSTALVTTCQCSGGSSPLFPRVSSRVHRFSSNLKLQFHSVVRQAHAIRERSIRPLMRQVMADVSEKHPLGLQAFCDLQGLVHAGMRGMRFVAQGIQEKDVQALQ